MFQSRVQNETQYLVSSRVLGLIADLSRREARSLRYTAFGSRLQGVLQAAVESGYFERNTAHGIQIGGREPKKRCTVPDPQQMQQLLPRLPEPSRTAVLADHGTIWPKHKNDSEDLV